MLPTYTDPVIHVTGDNADIPCRVAIVRAIDTSKELGAPSIQVSIFTQNVAAPVTVGVVGVNHWHYPIDCPKVGAS